MDYLKSFLVLWIILGSATWLCGLILFAVATYRNRISFATLSLFLLSIGLATLGLVKSITVNPKAPDKVDAATEESELVKLLSGTRDTPLTSEDVERLSRSNQIGTNEWMRLLLYRIQIRKSLAALAANANIKTDDPEKSLTKWINVDSDHLLLTQEQEKRLCKLRDDSHYFEWQEGKLPSNATVKELGEMEPTILDALGEDLKRPEPMVYKGEPKPDRCPPFQR